MRNCLFFREAGAHVAEGHGELHIAEASRGDGGLHDGLGLREGEVHGLERVADQEAGAVQLLGVQDGVDHARAAGLGGYHALKAGHAHSSSSRRWPWADPSAAGTWRSRCGLRPRESGRRRRRPCP